MDTSGRTAMMATISAIGTLRQNTRGTTQASALQNGEESGVSKTCLLLEMYNIQWLRSALEQITSQMSTLAVDRERGAHTSIIMLRLMQVVDTIM
jgi:hypothetical protein